MVAVMYVLLFYCKLLTSQHRYAISSVIVNNIIIVCISQWQLIVLIAVSVDANVVVVTPMCYV